MIAQYTFGGLIILSSLILIGIGICVICKGKRNGFIFVLLGSIYIFPGVVVIMDEGAPTKQDVFDGKAYYQETQVITGNDTIKTYDIVWKQKN